MSNRRWLTLPALAAGVLLWAAATPLRAGAGERHQFPPTLVENTTGQPDATFIGPPDNDFGDLTDQYVVYEFDCGFIHDGPGGDFTVYEADSDAPEFERMDVLVSANGSDFISVKSTEGPAVRIPGDEAHGDFAFARSYDLDAAALPLVRFVKVDGLVTDDGFDLDAIGAIHFVITCDADGDGVHNALDVCPNTPEAITVDAEGRPLSDADGDCDTDLEDYAIYQQTMTGSIVPPVVIDTVPVGNPGNAQDPYPSGGAVDYLYRIGKYEVTAAQYTAFLNAVAATDTYGLYSNSMWSSDYGCRIERTGSPGSFTYSVAEDWADRPVNFVSWGDAVRFANWLHNGQPEGAQDLTSTEDGSYFLGGATSDAELDEVTREPDATWVLPSKAEWHKAAYHYNDGVTGNYYDYPTGSDSGPSNQLIDPDPGNNATFWDNDGPTRATIGAPYWRTEVGAHENSESPYGTFDQAGNVYEWSEQPWTDYGDRALLGGSYESHRGALHASTTFRNLPTYEFRLGGIRVAKVR